MVCRFRFPLIRMCSTFIRLTFDNLENLSPEFLKEVEDMKVSNPEKYGHVVIGRWADVAEGAVFKKWGIVKEFPQDVRR